MLQADYHITDAEPARFSASIEQLNAAFSDHVDTILVHAVAYQANGWTILPLERFNNVPHRRLLGSGWGFCECTAKGNPLVGTRDAAQVACWLADDPSMNLGIVTGARSRLMLIDLDRHDYDGPAAFERWRYERAQEGKCLPEHPMSRSASGLHLWFATPEGAHVPTNGGWLPGVEVKACGGQVAVPPSLRTIKVPGALGALDDGESPQDETRYVRQDWLRTPPLPIAPDWFLEDVATRSDGRVARGGGATGNGKRESNIPTTEEFLERGFGFDGGHREPDARDLACRLVRRHWPNHDLVVHIMRQVWEVTPDRPGGKPFTWRDCLAKIHSAERFIGPKVEEDIALADRIYASLGGAR